MPYTQVEKNIAQIIERSRFHDEMFLPDSKTGAADIIKYLQDNDLLSVGRVIKLSEYQLLNEAKVYY